MTVGYEYLKDTRVADRGITSFQGRPADVDPSTFYGNPADSHVNADVNLGTVSLEHRTGSVTIRTRTLIGGYDRSYQNFVPGAVTADASQVSLSAYNNATNRTNFFQQADLAYARSTGPLTHTFLVGAEAGRQLTDNFRNTGYFNNAVTSILAPFDSPTISTPVTFRQSATDADNHVITNVAAVFAQDQVAVSRQVQVIGGVRFDRFDLEYHNNRNGETLGRVDHLVSPRAGVVYKPVEPLSLYGSYSVSYLPSSGDQFSSLTTITQQVEPERFDNYEVGAKWDLRGLALTTAIYRLDRTNTRSTDPERPDAHRPDRESADQWVRARSEWTAAAWVEHGRRLRIPGCVRHERHGVGTRGSAGGPGPAPHLLALEQLPHPSAHFGRGRSDPSHR